MEHKQYNLEDQTVPKNQEEDSFISSGNIVRTDKDLNVKNFFGVNNVEAHNKIGNKINVTLVSSGMASIYTVNLTDFIIAVTDVIISRTINLPKPSLAGFGKVFIVKDASGSATTTTIAITPFSTETIDGDTSNGITTNYGFKGFYTDGTNWFTA